MTYKATFSPGPVSIIFGTFHTGMESSYSPHLPNLTFIDKETPFLWENSLTAGSHPDNRISQNYADYTYKFTPYPESPMGTETTLTTGNMMATKMNYVNPPNHGLTKETQGKKNENYCVRP